MKLPGGDGGGRCRQPPRAVDRPKARVAAAIRPVAAQPRTFQLVEIVNSPMMDAFELIMSSSAMTGTATPLMTADHTSALTGFNSKKLAGLAGTYDPAGMRGNPLSPRYSESMRP